MGAAADRMFARARHWDLRRRVQWWRKLVETYNWPGIFMILEYCDF